MILRAEIGEIETRNQKQILCQVDGRPMNDNNRRKKGSTALQTGAILQVRRSSFGQGGESHESQRRSGQYPEQGVDGGRKKGAWVEGVIWLGIIGFLVFCVALGQIALWVMGDE